MTPLKAPFGEHELEILGNIRIVEIDGKEAITLS